MDKTTHLIPELASKYSIAANVVENLMREEEAAYSNQARVTNFIPIFVARRVEDRLRTRDYVHSSDASRRV